MLMLNSLADKGLAGFQRYWCLRQTLQRKLEQYAGGEHFILQHLCSRSVPKCKLTADQRVPGEPNVSFAVARLLWTVVRQSFMIQWKLDERYKLSVKESIM